LLPHRQFLASRFRLRFALALFVGVRINERLERMARAHHGVVTLDDWIKGGNSRASWYRNPGDGLVFLGPNVARLAGAKITPEQRIYAATRAAKGSVASHRSAAYLWKLDVVGDDPVDLVVGQTSGLALTGVELHRPKDRADLRPIYWKGVPTTTAVRTLLDLGAVAPQAVAPGLEQLVIRRILTVAGIQRAIAEHREHGRHGVTVLDRAVRELTLGAKPPDSVLEPVMGRLFERRRIDGWVFHLVVGGMELDFGFPEHRVDVEVDGWSSHSTREQFERDRVRDAELGALGWLVLRFTWNQVTRRRAWVASRIAATLASRQT
jgi:very-short-patch-repair endonuclease